jgi:hypothetical protein
VLYEEEEEEEEVILVSGYDRIYRAERFSDTNSKKCQLSL